MAAAAAGPTSFAIRCEEHASEQQPQQQAKDPPAQRAGLPLLQEQPSGGSSDPATAGSLSLSSDRTQNAVAADDNTSAAPPLPASPTRLPSCSLHMARVDSVQLRGLTCGLSHLIVNEESPMDVCGLDALGSPGGSSYAPGGSRADLGGMLAFGANETDLLAAAMGGAGTSAGGLLGNISGTSSALLNQLRSGTGGGAGNSSNGPVSRRRSRELAGLTSGGSLERCRSAPLGAPGRFSLDAQRRGMLGTSPRVPTPSNLGTGRPSVDAAVLPSAARGSGAVMGYPAGKLPPLPEGQRMAWGLPTNPLHISPAGGPPMPANAAAAAMMAAAGSNMHPGMAMGMGMGMGMGMNPMGMNMGMMGMGMMPMGMPMGMGMNGMGMARAGSWAPGMGSSSMPEQLMFGMGPMSVPMMGNTPDGMAAEISVPMSGSAVPDHMLPSAQPPPGMHVSASAPFLSHAHSMPAFGTGSSPHGPSKLARTGTTGAPTHQHQDLPALSQTFFNSATGGTMGGATAGVAAAGDTGVREASPEPDLGGFLGAGFTDELGPTLNRNSSNMGLLDGADALLLGTGGPSSLDLLGMGADLGGAGGGMDDPLAALDPLLLEADCGPAMSVGRPGTAGAPGCGELSADWLTAVDSPVASSVPSLGLSLRKTPSLVNMITASMEMGGPASSTNDLIGDGGAAAQAAGGASPLLSKRSGATAGRVQGSSRASRRR